MRNIILIISFTIVISSCQSSQGNLKSYKENPCEDIFYLKLKKMKVSEMTGAESEYFKKKNIECKEFREDVKTQKTDNDFIVIMAVVAVIAAAVVPFILLFKMH